jgi:hypothetical protein
MERRDFIQLSAFTAAAISLPLLHSCGPQLSETAISKPAFLSRLFDETTIRNTGTGYIQKTPAENDEDTLTKLLSGDSNIRKSSDEAAIHQYLDEKVRRDFETGNTVLVNGWILSVTEARQCALYSLVHS